jgi:manganese/zinc/iron transport system substrate-binding protein
MICNKREGFPMPLRRALQIVAATAVLALTAAPAVSQTFTSLATTGMVGDAVKAVVGDAGKVEVLLGSGVDPHSYKPTRADIARLSNADIVFYNGLLLEGKMTDALVRVANAGRPVVPVTEALDEKFLLEPEGFDGQYDPHVWMDVTGWKKAVEAVRDSLVKYRPALADKFRANAARYLGELDTLDKYVRGILTSVPKQSRVLITAHDAFNYFGRAYDFEVLGIQGISTESEAGLKRIQELVDLLVSRKIGAVFVESTVSDRNVRALIEGARAKGHTVKVGGELFSDAMGVSGTYEGTYVGMIDHNATIISKALGGTTPARGMAGRLAHAD